MVVSIDSDCLGFCKFVESSSIQFTGDARNDFSQVLSQVFHDMGNNIQDNPDLIDLEITDVYSPLKIEDVQIRSGWDVRSVFYWYEGKLDTLHIGIDCYGICGDADGDGDADVASDGLKDIEGDDSAGLKDGEYFALLIDTRNYGAYSRTMVPNFQPKLVIGTPELLEVEESDDMVGGLGYDGFNIYHFDSITYQSNESHMDAIVNFSRPLNEHDNPIFNLVDPMLRETSGDIEFSIKNISLIPGFVWNTSVIEYPDGQGGTFKPFNTMRFSFSLITGSSKDASIGSDFIPEVSSESQPGITISLKCPYELDIKDRCCGLEHRDRCDVCFGNKEDVDYCGICFGKNSLMNSCGECIFGEPKDTTCPAAIKNLRKIRLNDVIDNLADDEVMEIAYVGDIDKNGFKDIIIGLPDKEIAIVLLMESMTTVLNTITLSVESSYEDTEFGFSIADVGETDNNNYAVVIGAPNNKDGMGSVYMFFIYPNASFTFSEFYVNDESKRRFGHTLALVEEFPKLTIAVGAPETLWSNRPNVIGKLFFVYLRIDGDTFNSWPLFESDGFSDLLDSMSTKYSTIKAGDQIEYIGTDPKTKTLVLATSFFVENESESKNLIYGFKIDDTKATTFVISVSDIPISNIVSVRKLIKHAGDLDGNGIADLFISVETAPTKNETAKGLLVALFLDSKYSVSRHQLIGGGYGHFVYSLPLNSTMGSSFSIRNIDSKNYILSTNHAYDTPPTLLLMETKGIETTDPPSPEATDGGVVIIPPTSEDINVILPKDEMPIPGPPIIVEHPNYTPDFRIRPERASRAHATLFFESMVERSGVDYVSEMRFPKISGAYTFAKAQNSTRWKLNVDEEENEDAFIFEIETALFEEEALIQLLDSERVFRVGRNTQKWTFIGHNWPFDSPTNEFELYMRLELSSPILMTSYKNYKSSDEEITRITLSTIDAEIRISLPHLAIVDDSVVSYVTPDFKQKENELILIIKLPHFFNKILYDPDITIIDNSDINPPQGHIIEGHLEMWHIIIIAVGALFFVIISITLVIVCRNKQMKIAKAEKQWKLAASPVDNSM